MEMQFFVRLLFCHELLFFHISYNYSNFHIVICLLVLILHMGDAMQTTRLLQKLYIILCHRLYLSHSVNFFVYGLCNAVLQKPDNCKNYSYLFLFLT